MDVFGMRDQRVADYSAFITSRTAWDAQRAIASWLMGRILELMHTVWDLEPFAHDLGYDGPPFRWDEERRFLLRCELDVADFHLCGIERADVGYIMETFPIVKRNDVKAHGEYRTKRVILEIYDAIVEAIRTGVPYQTRLDPPPADPRVAHPARPDLEPNSQLIGGTRGSTIESAR